MSVFVAKILNSNNNWTSVTALTNTKAGVTGISNGLEYQYGFEHWLNNDFLTDLKIGYIDCYRDTSYPQLAERIILFCFDGQTVWYVGDLLNVKPLDPTEIEQIRIALEQGGWLESIRNHFDNIGDNRDLDDTHEYMKHYDADHIVDKPDTNPFVLNIRYDQLTFLQEPINLSNIYPEIEHKWRRLTNRFKTIPPQLHEVLGI